MGNCWLKKQKIEEIPLIVNFDVGTMEIDKSIESPSFHSLMVEAVSSLESQSPRQVSVESTPPTPPPSPSVKNGVISFPVKKKKLLNELVKKVPEIKANFRWKSLHISQFNKVYSPKKYRFSQEKYIEHMLKANVCQLCETIFPDSSYLKILNKEDDPGVKYCLTCSKFLLGKE